MKSHHQVFLAIVIASGVIAFWRGLWGLMDLYLFPHNEAISSLMSILIGLAVLGATHYIVKELM
jgi:hypothetical protein